MAARRPVVLAVLDGYGLREEAQGNAVSAADTPNLSRYFGRWPCCRLTASGEEVGLPSGQMGNSEVGHANLGAGRIVYQDLSRLNRAAAAGFGQNPVLTAACDRAAAGGALHLLGLLSDGGVHSHIRHLEAMLRLAAERGVTRLYLHMFTDGRDVAPTSGAGFVGELEAFLRALGVGQIATLSGRYYAMDRDNRWERVERAYRCMTEPPDVWADAASVVRRSYEAGVTDEFIEPAACCEGGRIAAGDTVVAMNFRADRMRELMRALLDPAFDGFSRAAIPDLHGVTLTEYEEKLPGATVAFGPEVMRDTLGDVLEAAGLSQLRVAETEKYAHVTFFFDGGSETARAREERVLIPSAKVATYDLQPEMCARQVTDAALGGLGCDFVLLNYANCDMVGHTGSFGAAVAAVEAVDREIGRLGEAVLAAGGVLIITADHGNAEEMTTPDGAPMTAHTTCPVPFCTVGSEAPLRDGILADAAPTVLALLGCPAPGAMSGRPLLK